MSVTQIAIVILFTALAAICAGSLGIGVGLVASVPLLAIDPAFVPGPLLLGGQIIGMRHIIVEWEHLPRPALGRSIIGLPFGAVAGLALLEMMPERALAVFIGVSLVIATLLLLAGVRVEPRPSVEVFAGAMAAFCSITAALPGPPVVMAHSHLEPRQFRALASGFIFVISIVTLVLLMVSGNFGRHEFELLALMLPGLLLGLFLSRWTRPLLEGRAFFRTLILVLALLAGLLLIARQL